MRMGGYPFYVSLADVQLSQLPFVVAYFEYYILAQDIFRLRDVHGYCMSQFALPLPVVRNLMFNPL